MRLARATRHKFVYILRTAKGLEKCSQNEGRVGYLPLESNINNWSNTAYLKTKIDMLFFTIKHCKFFTLTKVMAQGSRWENVCAWRFFFFFFFFFFLRFDPALFTPFSLSFPSFSFAFSCAFRMLGHLSRAWLVLTGLRYKGKTVNRTFLVRNFDHFFLLRKPFAPFLYLLQSSCSYYYHPAYCRIKWY